MFQYSSLAEKPFDQWEIATQRRTCEASRLWPSFRPSQTKWLIALDNWWCPWQFKVCFSLFPISISKIYIADRAFGIFFLKISFIVSAVYPYQTGAAEPTCSSRLSFQPRALISFWQLGLPSIFQSIIQSIQQGFHRHLILINLSMMKIWTCTGTYMWGKLSTLYRHVSQTNFKTCKCTGDHP